MRGKNRKIALWCWTAANWFLATRPRRRACPQFGRKIQKIQIIGASGTPQHEDLPVQGILCDLLDLRSRAFASLSGSRQETPSSLVDAGIEFERLCHISKVVILRPECLIIRLHLRLKISGRRILARVPEAEARDTLITSWTPQKAAAEGSSSGQ